MATRESSASSLASESEANSRSPLIQPDFSPPREYGATILPRFPGWWAALGPGVIWMALAQGSGELIWWPYFCAKYGLGFLFLLAPACLLQYAVTFEIGRYSALTGESIWRGFVRLHPLFGFVLWILMAISFLWFGAFATAGGTAMARLVEWPNLDERGRSLFWALLSMVVFAFALLTQKRTYQLIEKVMWAVALTTIAGLIVSCFGKPVRGFWPEFLQAMFVPPPLARPWESGDTDRLLTAITFAGLGGFWTLFYSYWILGKGTGCARHRLSHGAVPDSAEGSLAVEGARWRRFLLLDTGIGVFGNLATTLMACFLAYVVLFPKGIVPDEWRLAAEQSQFFAGAWGEMGRLLFLLISAAFLCDTWLSTADAVARVHIEMLRFYFVRNRVVDERRWYRIMILILTGITGLTMFANQPGTLIVLSALIGFLGTVIFTFALIFLVHGPLRRALPDPLKPGKASLILLSISAIAYTLLAVAYVWVKFFF
jgi:Mn2+/Fe2+ NRAMP family transporter